MIVVQHGSKRVFVDSSRRGRFIYLFILVGHPQLCKTVSSSHPQRITVGRIPYGRPGFRLSLNLGLEF